MIRKASLLLNYRTGMTTAASSDKSQQQRRIRKLQISDSSGSDCSLEDNPRQNTSAVVAPTESIQACIERIQNASRMIAESESTCANTIAQPDALTGQLKDYQARTHSVVT